MSKYDPVWFREYYLRNRTRRLLADRCRRYHVTVDWILYQFAEQGGRCGICREPIDMAKGGKGGWHIDHNHLTKVARGILCCHCNRLLGAAKDNLLVLAAAIKYLSE